MIKFSIILPCYNEFENLAEVFNVYKEVLNPDETELIVVNNGSTDKTAEFLKRNTDNYSFIKVVEISKNQGYGYGIMQGIQKAKGNWVGWTHADLQADPKDIAKAIEICRTKPLDDLIYVKGYRIGRTPFANFFSTGMEFCVKLILHQDLKEINAQPNLFNRELINNAKKYPYHWGLDLFFYYLAQKKSYKFERISVLFPERKFGKSKWNKGVFSRIKFSLKMLKYCFEIKKDENN
ncbi:MAG TPA: glycosyltransferase family 2 protein [Bacteroidales bacterium]|nr:glycosyltransferase family 2 protein [Bacteroidales bacterium]